MQQLRTDKQVLENAADALAAECMAKKGYRYEPTVVPVSRQADPYAAPRLDPTKTRIEGYGRLMGGPSMETGSVNPGDTSIDRLLKSLPRAQRNGFRNAFLGTQRETVAVEGGGMSIPKNGCLADGRRAVSGPAFKAWTTIEDAMANAVALANNRVEIDKTYLAASEDWSQCMSRRGYHYKTANEAIGDALARYGREDVASAERVVSEDEKKLATADAACRLTSRLQPTVIRLQRKYERRAMRAVESPMSSWLEGRSAVLKRAEAALRQSGG